MTASPTLSLEGETSHVAEPHTLLVREWLVTNGALPTDLVTRNRRIAAASLSLA